MKKIFKKLSISILSVGLVLSLGSFNKINAMNEYTENEKSIMEKMEKEGISKVKQIGLIEKVRKGGVPLSLSQTEKVEPTVVKKFNGDVELVYYYSDGSFMKTSITQENKNNNITLYSVDGGNLESGNHVGGWWTRKKMRIYHDFLVGTIGFYADAYGSNNNATISSVYDEWAAGIAVNFSTPSLQKLNSNHAVLKVTIYAPGGFASNYMKLHFYIYGMNNYHSEYKG